MHACFISAKISKPDPLLTINKPQNPPTTDQGSGDVHSAQLYIEVVLTCAGESFLEWMGCNNDVRFASC